MRNNMSAVEELERLLRDERERCSLHKQNYQEIKDEYLKLQDELVSIYEQLKETRSRNDLMKSAHQTGLRKLEEKIKEKELEIHSLTKKIESLDSRKIRDAVLDEATSHYESKIKEMHSETDKMRDEYNNMRYENAILKCRYESRETEFSRTLGRVQVEHLSEIEQLQNKIKSYENEKTPPSDLYAVELKSAKREILELDSKTKVLLSECDDLRAQNENLTLQMNDLLRNASKQAADNTNNLRTLESEKTKVLRQLEVCNKELSNAQEHRKALNIELQVCKQEVLSLQAKLEESDHNLKMTVANLQEEVMQLKSQNESEQEELAEEITKLKGELSSLEANFAQERHMILTKEQDLKKNLITSRQQFLKLSNEVEQERETIERKFKEFEADKNNLIENLNQEIQSLKQKLYSCNVSKAELEKELISLRECSEELSNKASVGKNGALNYNKEIQDLKDKFQLLAANWNKQEEVKERPNTASSQKSQQERDYEILQMKLTWEQQKLHFQQRLEEVESQLRDSRNNSLSEKRELEFKIKQFTNQNSKLKEKVESQKEKLYSQRDLLEKSVPAEVHVQVKNQLIDLQRRLEEYRKLITAEPSYFLKQQSSAPVFPSKMLADIKNIDFKGFSHQVMSNNHTLMAAEAKGTDKGGPKKRALSTRRKSSNTKEKVTSSKTVAPVYTSSSDIEWENI